MRYLLEQRFNAVSQQAKSMMASGGDIEISRDPVAEGMDEILMLIRQKARALQRGQMPDSLLWSKDRQFVDSMDALWFATEEELAPYYEWRGRKLVELGSEDEALAAWCRLYAVEPEAASDNESFQSSCERSVSVIPSRFAFRKLCSASHPNLRYPYGIVASVEQQLVYVSDPNLDELFRFTLEGVFVDTVSLGGGQVFGLGESDCRVWCCDYKNRTLVAIDEAGNIEQNAAFQTVLSVYQEFSPFTVTTFGGACYVLLVKELDRQECVLVGFDPDGDGRVLSAVELNGFQPADVVVHDDSAWFVSLQHGFVFVADLSTGEVCEFSRVSSGQRGLGITYCRGDLFVCGTGHISKIDLEGEVVFRRNMYTYGDRITYVQKGVSAIDHEKMQRLYFADNSGTIEIFDV